MSSSGVRFQRRRRLPSSLANKKELPQFKTDPGANWDQLQKSIDSTNTLLKTQGDDEAAAELAGLLNSFQTSVKERGKGD